MDLDIARGDFVAIMGPSGSGKSTAMNTLGCLDRPTAGTYLSRAFAWSRSRATSGRLRRRFFGFVFQGFNLLARTSAQENVELPLLYRGESARAPMPPPHGPSMRWVSGLGTPYAGRTVGRAAAARGHCAPIVTEPAVLLADEPTGNLIPSAAMKSWNCSGSSTTIRASPC